jgi:hypothetical protein
MIDLKTPKTIIFWIEAADGIRRAAAIRNNTKSPKRTKIYKHLNQQFNEGKTNSFGWLIYRPGPMEAKFIKLGTPVNTII